MFDHYGGIFDCFYPGKGVVRTLVMAGNYTCDDVYKTTKKIKKDFVENFMGNAEKNKMLIWTGRMLE